jgi:Zn-dependent protease with chaperone function
MNFFDAQENARRTSKRLVYAYLFSAALMVAGVTLVVAGALISVGYVDHGEQAPILIGVAMAAALLIAGATLHKTAILSSGGGRVAVALGGVPVPSDVQDPLRRRLRNVVEEMAIASGTPVPEIYVLEQESGINAFAAGYEPGDAAIAVTRGALETLDRDELQGVIGHEFSHILNGDMRLNIRLMGVLFGIMVLGLIGRMMLRGARHGRGRSAGAALAIGLGLTILGGIGVFMARLIKASVSRQREFLADASAVQFTRQRTGIANALKKIGGYREHSYLQAADPEEVSHMLFGSGSRLSSLFATHPPLTERIQAIDPSFKPDDYPEVHRHDSVDVPEAAAFAGAAAGAAGAGSPVADAMPEAIAEMVGQPEMEHVGYAAGLRASIPETLYDAAHSTDLSFLLVISLVLDRSGRTVSPQLSLIRQQMGRDRARLIREYYDSLRNTGAEYRLPLMEIAFPALKRRPEPELQYLLKLTSDLIDVDGDIDLYEYCFYRVLVANTQQAKCARPVGAAGKMRIANPYAAPL